MIGKTAVIGRNVRLYQGVTLGAKRFETEETGSLRKGYPRHPIVEDDVVIYAGATILGWIVIGRGASVSGGRLADAERRAGEPGHAGPGKAGRVQPWRWRMRKADMLLATDAGALWRRALAALAHAFDPAREGDYTDTVFQPASARERAEPRSDCDDPLRPPRAPEDTLQ